MNPLPLRTLVSFTLLSLAGCGGMAIMEDPPAAPPAPTARVRVLHLSPDAPAVDAYLGDTKVATRLAFPTGTSVLKPNAGKAAVKVTASGSSAAVAQLDDVRLETDRDYTIFAFGKLAALQLKAIEDDTAGLASASVRVRVIHAADGVGPVNVLQVQQSGPAIPLVENLRFGVAAAPVDVAPEAMTVALDVNLDRQPDVLFSVPALPKGSVVNVFAVKGEAGAFLVAQLPGASIVRIEPEVAQLRVLHLSPNAPTVRPFVDGALPSTWQPIAFGGSTPYTAFAAGAHRLDVSAGMTATPAVLSAPSLPLTAGGRFTAAAIGTTSGLRAIFFENSSTNLGTGNIRLRAIHAAPSVGTVDLFTLGANGVAQPLLSRVGFGDVSNPIDVRAGAYTVGVDVNADAKPDLWFELPALTEGTVANVYVTETSTGSVFALAQLDGAATALIEKATSKVRVIHLSRNAPDVDVYANGSRVVSTLPYGQSTVALTVPSGSYDLAVTAAGAPASSAVIRADGTAFLPGKAYTVAAYGDLAGIRARVVEDDANGLNMMTDVRLNVIHVAPNVTRGDLYAVRTSGNLLLAPNLGFGDGARLSDLPSSSYRVGFDAEANGTIDIAFNLPVLAPGSFANVFVATDPQGQVYLLVQTTGAGTLRVMPSP